MSQTKLLKIGRLVPSSLSDTKTATGYFAIGYRNAKGRFGGTPKPVRSVTVRPVGNKWGVFDLNPKKRGRK